MHLSPPNEMHNGKNGLILFGSLVKGYLRNQQPSDTIAKAISCSPQNYHSTLLLKTANILLEIYQVYTMIFLIYQEEFELEPNKSLQPY